MKKLILAVAGIVMATVGNAQFTADGPGGCGTIYRRPCGAIQGYSVSDPVGGMGSYQIDNGFTTDVHGADALNSHYAVGHYDVGVNDKDIFLLFKSKVSGNITAMLSFDINTEYINLYSSSPYGIGTGDDRAGKMTVDETNHLIYILGSFSIGMSGASTLICVDYNSTPTISWINFLNDGAVDVAIDNNGDVFALCNSSTNWHLDKFDNTGSSLGSFNSSSFGALNQYGAFSLEYDNNANRFYITGVQSGSGALWGINANLTSHGSGTTSATHLGAQYFVDWDAANSKVITVGDYNSFFSWVSWASWDVSTSSYSVTNSSYSTGGNEIARDLIVSPNGDRIIVVDDINTSDRYLTWIDPSLNLGNGDVDFSSYAYKFDVNDYYVPWCLNKDADGSIIVGGWNVVDNEVFTGKFHLAGLTSWTPYENILPTNVKNISKDAGFKIYPNPASTSIKVVLNKAGAETTYRITNTLGQQVAAGSLERTNTTVDISKLMAGSYYIQLVTDKKIVGSQMFVKE